MRIKMHIPAYDNENRPGNKAGTKLYIAALKFYPARNYSFL